MRVRRVAGIIPRRVGGDGATRVLPAGAATVPICLNAGIVLRSAGAQVLADSNATTKRALVTMT
jgi:hypothetical protein